MGEKQYTSCCGLYCPDCIPSREELFATVGKLETMLAELSFDKYAAYKARNNPVFAGYPEFYKVLQEIKTLKCKALCCDGGSKAGCMVRECAIKKGFAGCWECDDYKQCAHLQPLKSNHEDLEHNLTMIREYGLDNWISKRGKHYSWNERPYNV